MSVFTNKKGIYQIDFVLKGHRVQRNAETRNRREAEALEKTLRKELLADIEQQKAAGKGPLTLDIAFGRYWQEVGQHHANAADTWRDIARLIGRLGKNTRLDQITDRDVAELVAWRASHTIGGKTVRKDGSPMPCISSATVNRTCTLVLKNLFGRAKRVWRYSFPNEPIWRDHLLKEPQERTRELHDHEAEALEAAVRADYAPWLEFARLTGLRRRETLLRWRDVNWGAKQITIMGKGGRKVTTPITEAVRFLLEPLKGHHPEWVFTYTAMKTRAGKVRGQRYPITLEGAKTQWRRTREKAGVVDFRFHDIRHDVGTKLLRATGNVKLVQRTLNHADIKTTLRYAHVLDDEVAAGLEALANRRRKVPEEVPAAAKTAKATN
ncbi:tyrosine-type recombinase/integrase [Frigidibacter oleivorans]|uniref:tyrosine-type recombinase/integrase n=1 Tax=Frigidibacter oleivorans TaxID=2487129 RepID=UPI000F8EEA0E|nr:site-specific integrase [Frigidibacter oleivorans]